MSWLRLDGGAARHPKLEGLNPAQKWAWIELLLWCAEDRRAGRIPADRSMLPRAVTDELLLELERRKLLDRDRAGQLTVHDWQQFNGARTGAERTAAWRDRKHGKDRYYGPAKAHGGTRGEYAQTRTATSSVTPGDVTKTSPSGAGVPSNTLTPKPQPPVGAKADATAALLDALGDVDDSVRAFVRAEAGALPTGEVERLVAFVREGQLRDPVAFVVSELRWSGV